MSTARPWLSTPARRRVGVLDGAGGNRAVPCRLRCTPVSRYPWGVPLRRRPVTETASQHGYIASKDDYLRRLRRIEGQARGLQKMVTDEKYCIDILTQVSAMTSALQSVALGLLEEHLSHCVVRAAAQGGPEAEEKIQVASAAIARLVRS